MIRREPISLSAFAEMLGIEPTRFVGLEVERQNLKTPSTRIILITEEPDDADQRHLPAPER